MIADSDQLCVGTKDKGINVYNQEFSKVYILTALEK